ncbi:uncharacterized protein PRCAT00003024001 [Priceomyces carsonii]|uniref:uncharacterized protein n=1 Tax=Priceomyces carsonii TaxID=28549 RepID=UPI002ED9CCB8|nr:unnamed protein product [Priceomyces carsonii]
MSESDISHLNHENSDLDNPMRVVIVINSTSHPDGEYEEKLVDSIQSFEQMNNFFDSFDESVALPNEGHIKYEVGSDGLVVIVVDSLELKHKALEFIDTYITEDAKDSDEQVSKNS